jgi:tetratricopeptide (TPR) repeat protein
MTRVICMAFVLSVASTGFAQEPTGGLQSEAPAQPAPAKEPLNPLNLLVYLGQAEDAEKAGDLEAAAVAYEKAGELVPDRSLTFSRACALREKLGQREAAMALCERAIGLQGVGVADYTRYVDLMVAAPGELPADQVADADAIVEHLKEQDKNGNSAALIQCKVGARTNDVRRLTECTRALAQRIPGDPTTLTYQFALALLQNDLSAARAVLEKVTGKFPEPAVERMRAALEKVANKGVWRMGLWGAILLALAGLGLVAARFLRRQPRPPMPAA